MIAFDYKANNLPLSLQTLKIPKYISYLFKIPFGCKINCVEYYI
jgi:hypothetical protein